jgi:hypothetical protein
MENNISENLHIFFFTESIDSINLIRERLRIDGPSRVRVVNTSNPELAAALVDELKTNDRLLDVDVSFVSGSDYDSIYLGLSKISKDEERLGEIKNTTISIIDVPLPVFGHIFSSSFYIDARVNYIEFDGNWGRTHNVPRIPDIARFGKTKIRVIAMLYVSPDISVSELTFQLKKTNLISKDIRENAIYKHVEELTKEKIIDKDGKRNSMMKLSSLGVNLYKVLYQKGKIPTIHVERDEIKF